MDTTLTVPKPDQKICWNIKAFPYPRALASPGSYTYAVTQTSKLLFPTFTIEGKGDLGSLNVGDEGVKYWIKQSIGSLSRRQKNG
jgi:hypothetical protein